MGRQGGGSTLQGGLWPLVQRNCSAAGGKLCGRPAGWLLDRTQLRLPPTICLGAQHSSASSPPEAPGTCPTCPAGATSRARRAAPRAAAMPWLRWAAHPATHPPSRPGGAAARWGVWEVVAAVACWGHVHHEGKHSWAAIACTLRRLAGGSMPAIVCPTDLFSSTGCLTAGGGPLARAHPRGAERDAGQARREAEAAAGEGCGAGCRALARAARLLAGCASS